MHVRPSLFFLAVLTACLFPGASFCALAAGSSPPPAPKALSLEEALLIARQNRPELKNPVFELEASRVRAMLADKPPNPELELEVDNLGGEAPAGETEEVTVALGQTIEMGGKASARRARAEAEILRLGRERAAAWFEIAAEVRGAHLEALAARERLSLAREGERIAGELAGIARERVTAGELAATEAIRAEAREAEARAEALKAGRLLTDAELGLAVALGESVPVTVAAGEELTPNVPEPDGESLFTGLEQAPLLELRRSETSLARADLARERAGAWSDPTLSLGVREVPDQNARSFILGLSMPLPLFQRNQSAIADADASLRKAAALEGAAARRLRAELARAHSALAAASREAGTLRVEVLARAEEAAAAVQEGFREGKFRYTDVLESSLSLLAAKNRHLDALLDLHRASINLDRLLGRPALSDPAHPATIP